MATNESSARSGEPSDLHGGAGISHPTVVPTNYDPDEADGRDD